MPRSGKGLCLAAVAVLAAACGQVQGPAAPEPDAAVRKVSAAPRMATAQATTAWAEIINPLEEVNEFDPRGVLRWTEVTGADAYEVWVYDDYAETQTVEFSGALASRQYQFTRLAPGTQYQVRVYARVDGRWDSCCAVSFYTAKSVVKPRFGNPQEELEAFATGGTLRWSPVEGADSYEVWIYQDRALQALVETSGPLRVTQYPLRALPAGRTYYAQVYSRVDGVFHVGGALELTVVAESTRARIVNPQEELDAFAPGGLLRWTTAPGATAYEVWIFTNPNASEIHESSGSLATRTYAPRNLQPGSSYYAQVYALVQGEWQVGSPVRITTVAPATIARLTNPQEEIEAFATNGTLRWSEVPGADRYEVWIYVSAGLGRVAEAGFTAGRSHQVTRLCGGGVYYVQVYAHVDGQWTAGWATRLNVTQGESPSDCVPPVPLVTLAASPGEPRASETVALTWTSRFAGSCSASGDWAGPRPLSGTETVGPLATASRFTLWCGGPSGTTYAQVMVVIALPKYAAVRLPMNAAWALNESGDVGGADLVRLNMSGGAYAKYPAGAVAGERIDFFPAARPPGVALDVNARRQFVIGSDSPRAYVGPGYLYSDGTLVSLPALHPMAINDLGHIAGAAPGPPARAAVSADGVIVTLPTPAGLSSAAYDINAQDVVVGDWWDPNDQAWPWRTQAFRYVAGTLTQLGTLGGDSSHAEAVNAAGTVAGSARKASGSDHAFRYDESGMTDLGTLGCDPSAALGINSSGHIVGYSCAVPRTVHDRQWQSAFLFAYGFMYDLNDHLAGPIRESWMSLRRAADINDQGQIVVDACFAAFPSDCQAYLLTPIEEEGSP